MKKTLVIIILAALLLAAGCGAGSSAFPDSADRSETPAAQPAASDSAQAPQTEGESAAPAASGEPVDYNALLTTEGGDGMGVAGAEAADSPGDGGEVKADMASALAEQFVMWTKIDATGSSSSSVRPLSELFSSVGEWTVITGDENSLAGEMSGASLTVTALNGDTLTFWAATDLVRNVQCGHPVFYRTGLSLYDGMLAWCGYQEDSRK